VNDHFGKIVFSAKYLKSLQSDFSLYLKKCMKAVDNTSDSKKLVKLLNHKKIFSCVWLLPSAKYLLALPEQLK